MKWIPLSKRPPPDGQECAFYTPHDEPGWDPHYNIHYGTYSKRQEGFCEEGDPFLTENDEVSHWLSLEPPNDQNTEVD